MATADVEHEREALVRLVADLPPGLVSRALSLVQGLAHEPQHDASPHMPDAGAAVLPEPTSAAQADDLLQALLRAADEADAGSTVEHASVVAEMKARFAGRVPPSTWAGPSGE